MKTVKYVIGGLGIAFAILHVVIGAQKLFRGTTAGEFTVSMYAGHIFGICVGAIVAVVCLRKKPPGRA